MARWWKPRSSRKWRAAAAALWRWKNIRSIRARWPSRRGAWRRRRRQVDSIFIPDGADAVPQVVQALAAGGVNLKRVQLLGTGLWDDPRIFSDADARRRLVRGAGIGRLPQFLGRYRARYGAGSGAHGDARL